MNIAEQERRTQALGAVAVAMTDATPAEYEAMKRFVLDELAENASFTASEVPAFVERYRPRLARIVNVAAAELTGITTRPARASANESRELKAAFGG